MASAAFQQLVRGLGALQEIGITPDVVVKCRYIAQSHLNIFFGITASETRSHLREGFYIRTLLKVFQQAAPKTILLETSVAYAPM